MKEAAATEAKLGKVTFLIQGNIFSSARKKNDTRADLVVSVIEDRRSKPPGKKARLWVGGWAPGAAVDSELEQSPCDWQDLSPVQD